MSQAGATKTLVRTLFRRWEARESLNDIVDPDATFFSAMAPGRRYRGFAGMEQYRLDAAAGGWSVKPDIGEIYAEPGRALVVGTLIVTRGEIIDRIELIWGCREKGGKIIEGQAFHDRHEAWRWFETAG